MHALLDPGRSRDPQRVLALVLVEGGQQQDRNAGVVVAVEVRDHDGVDLVALDAEFAEARAGGGAAIEQHAAAGRAQQHRRLAPPAGAESVARADEDELAHESSPVALAGMERAPGEDAVARPQARRHVLAIPHDGSLQPSSCPERRASADHEVRLEAGALAPRLGVGVEVGEPRRAQVRRQVLGRRAHRLPGAACDVHHFSAYVAGARGELGASQSSKWLKTSRSGRSSKARAATTLAQT